MRDSSTPPLENHLARIALGDQAALRALYERTASHLYGIIVRIVKRRDPAEELLQEVYLSVWHHAADFDARTAQAMTWLIAIARNKALDAVRSAAQRRETGPAQDDDGNDVDIVDDTPGPLALLTAASEALSVRACLERTDASTRQSLALAYYQGLSHSEVAERLAAPLGTVKAWIRRGLESLRRCLEAHA